MADREAAIAVPRQHQTQVHEHTGTAPSIALHVSRDQVEDGDLPLTTGLLIPVDAGVAAGFPR